MTHAHTHTVNAIVDALRLHRIPAWAIKTGATKIQQRFIRFGVKGMADIVGILPPAGQFFCIEVKTGTGRLSSEQEYFLEAVGRAGGIALVARSVDDAGVQRLLQTA